MDNPLGGEAGFCVEAFLQQMANPLYPRHFMDKYWLECREAFKKTQN